MICKTCKSWNDDRANFCRNCGGELYKGTLVTSPITDSVTAYSIPTSGVRAFSGIGSGYLQSAAMSVRRDIEPRSDAYHSYPTGAKVYLDKSGTWICPDCGERNTHEKLYCVSCGKYR
ncbi:MAG: zinc ribbon domain-containing protein [Clostridia bacterium]|nr:zinc ribbon domain-containing protein [Clostridia bacterium]